MDSHSSNRARGVSRRQLLKATTACIAVGLVGRSGGALARGRTALPTVLHAEIFPFASAASAAFPEQSDLRYSAAAGQWGVSFSGGGPRAFSAALGQMRGLVTAGVLDRIGAVSCVSGGSWFGSLFTFAPPIYGDGALLGPYVAPADITVAEIQTLPADYLGTQLNALTNENLTIALTAYGIEVDQGKLPIDKVWARTLNTILLSGYGLDDTSTQFTLDEASADRIRAANPDVKLQTARPGRPFFIAGATQIYQPTRLRTVATEVGLPGQFYRSFEYTPLYVGTPQFFAAGPDGRTFGGGYVESFAFDTKAPTVAPTNDIATTRSGAFPFLLSDAIASSSSAPAAYVAEYLGQDDISVASFDYWPVRDVGRTDATEYAFGDGGLLENTGIIPLLRRGYKTILAFVNTPFPIGSDDDGCVSGIDGQISRLFGFVPKNDYGTSQKTQIFAKSQYDTIVNGLKNAKQNGLPPIVGGTFEILAGNPFGIAPYKPRTFWFYNANNRQWREKLPPAIQTVLKSEDYANYMANFPNYDTVVQNVDDYFIPEVLYLTARQINLLAHMWSYTVVEALRTPGEIAGIEVAS